MSQPDYRVRLAQPTDAAVIAHHRRAMSEEIGMIGDYAGMEQAFAVWVVPQIESGHYLGWLVLDSQDQVVAGAGVRMFEWAPTPMTPVIHFRPYILNVYVEQEHRRRGLARLLIEAIIAWGREQNIPMLTLHASDYGRPLYAELGFTDTNEMRLEFS